MTTALRRIIFIAMIAVIWEVTSRFSGMPDFMFPSLTQVLETLFNGLISGQIAMAIGKSFEPPFDRLFDCHFSRIYYGLFNLALQTRRRYAWIS